MHYSDFISRVIKRGGPTEPGKADVLVAAVIQTLVEHMDPGQADKMASQLPHELKDVARAPRLEQPLNYEQFIDRIARRADTPPQTVMPQVTAVMVTLREALSKGDFENILAGLPKQFVNLVVRI